MGATAHVDTIADDGPRPGRDRLPSAPGRSAARLAAVTLVAGVAVLYLSTIWLTGGTFTYPVDDPAIHLTVARRLAYDGTWGVVAGDYQAASSSPLWTVALAPTQWLARGAAGEVVPLVLNAVAGLWVIGLLRPDLAVLRPGPRRRLDAVAVVVVVVVLLFLPGLAFVGMEHTLHMALVLATALAVEARWAGANDRSGARDQDGHGRGRHGAGLWVRRAPAWAPFALMVLATATRFESAALVAALAAGLAAVGVRGWHDPAAPPPPGRRRLRGVAGLALAAGTTIAVSGAVNLAFGQEILPNSVVLKSLGDRGDTRRSLGAAVERFLSDPLLVAFAVVAVLVLVLTRRAAVRHRPVPSAAVFPAVVTLVATAAHAELGAVETSLRYQAYLYGLGTWTLLRSVPVLHELVASRWPRVPAAALVLALVPAAVLQVETTAGLPDDAAITWEQRYQVARFLGEAYRDDAIAIGELGYIALYHHGPLTDVYGLADHEVLEATLDGRKDAAFWHDLQQRRGFRVVVTYSFSLGNNQIPDGWLSVAEWRSPDAYFEVTRFLAAEPEEVAPLLAHLRAFEGRLPDEVEVRYNELAPMAAEVLIAQATGG
jgi:hypothetical protein